MRMGTVCFCAQGDIDEFYRLLNEIVVEGSED